MDDLFTIVCKTYLMTGSIGDTAKFIGKSAGKVRKILITKGEWSNSTCDEVALLKEQGLSNGEIAIKLGISVKSVLAYSPYSKTDYNKENRSASARYSERWRESRKLLEMTDRVLMPRGKYDFITPTSRDVLIYSGYFQFNLSGLIELARKMETTRIDLKYLNGHLEMEEKEFDEPVIVLEYNPLTLLKDEELDISTIETAYALVPLTCHRQIIAAKERGEQSMDVYLMRMEDYLPYMTNHFSEFARYWNEKLKSEIEYRKYEKI